MKRKEFIRTSSLALTGTAFAPLVSCLPEPRKEIAKTPIVERRNWGRNIVYKAKNFGLFFIENFMLLIFEHCISYNYSLNPLLKLGVVETIEII